MATAVQAAKHIFISPSRFRDLVSAGTITRKPSGGYKLDEVREQYIVNAQKIMAGRGSDGGAALSTQRAKLAAAQTATAEFRNAQTRGQFVKLSVMQRMLAGVFGVFREQSLTLAGKVSDGLTPFTPQDREAIYEVIRGEVYDMLNGLSDPNGMVAQAASVPSKTEHLR
jgi:hypothetical protein